MATLLNGTAAGFLDSTIERTQESGHEELCFATYD